MGFVGPEALSGKGQPGKGDQDEEHRDRDRPAERGQEGADRLISHHLAGPGALHDQHQEKRGEDPVNDRRPEEGGNRLDSGKGHRGAEHRRGQDDGVKVSRPRPSLSSPHGQPKSSETAKAEALERIGTASRPEPIIPAAMRRPANRPAIGSSAFAASAPVSIIVWPVLKRVTAVERMMKYITR